MPEATRTCSKCGREIANTSPQGLCPRCLLGRGLLSEVEDDFHDGAQQIGDYDLIEPIARGGMGIVYRARQRTLNRTVALKLISGGELAGDDFVERFRIEAEAAASLDHPNIVPIYEVGEDDGRHFFSMKLVEGGNLADQLSRQDCASAAKLISKLARAVHYAHQRGILHRDIKPNNVLLDTNCEPLLTDFGLAKLVERETQITRTLAVLGTPSYISPEQASGNVSQLTTGADVYGLGAVLYELLTGAPPFAGGTTMATIRQVLEKEPERPSRRNAAVDRDLETICLKCLEKEPARRYSSAEALAEDLERWSRHEPINARPVTAIERTAKWIRRHPAYSTMIAVIALALATVIAVLNISRTRVTAALDISEKQKAQIKQQQNELSARRRATVKQLSRALFLQGVQHAEANQTGPALAYWAHALRLDTNNSAAASRIFHTLARRLFAQPVFPPMEHEDFANSARFSPDGSRLAVASRGNKSQAWLRDAKTGRLLHAWPLGMPGALVRFTADGKRFGTAAGILGHGGGVVRVWDAFLGQPVGPEIKLPIDGASEILFSPNGDSLAVLSRNSVFVFDGDGSNQRFVLGGDATGLLFDAIWSLDSKMLLVGAHDAIRWFDAKTGSLLQKRNTSAPVYEMAASPDHRFIAFSYYDFVSVEETESGKVLANFRDVPSLKNLSFSSDGGTS